MFYFTTRFLFVQKCPLLRKMLLDKAAFPKFLNSSEMLKRAFLTFSESLKGVVTKMFLGASPTDPYISTPVLSGWRRPCLYVVICSKSYVSPPSAYLSLAAFRLPPTRFGFKRSRFQTKANRMCTLFYIIECQIKIVMLARREGAGPCLDLGG